MPTPLQVAQQEQQEQPRPSVLGRIAKTTTVVGGLGLAGTYGRGLLNRGVSKGTLTDVGGTLKAGLAGLKGDYATAKSALTKPGGIVQSAKDKFSAWNDNKLRPGLIDNSMTSANLSARTSRLRELNATVSEVYHFEKGADGRFVSVKRAEEDKPSSGLKTAAKVGGVVAGAGLIGAAVVGGRGAQFLKSRGAFKGGLTTDNVKRSLKVGANLIKGDAAKVADAGRKVVASVTDSRKGRLGDAIERGRKKLVGQTAPISGYGA